MVVTKGGAGGADVDGGPLRMGAVRVDLVVDEEDVEGDLIVTKGGGADVDGRPLRVGAVRVDFIIAEEGDLVVTKGGGGADVDGGRRRWRKN